MSERLSPHDEMQANIHRGNTEWAQIEVDRYQQEVDNYDGALKEQKESGASRSTIVGLENMRYSASIKRGKNEVVRDAALWRAKQHKDQHLDQYIETARQDAESAGVKINLPEKKEN